MAPLLHRAAIKSTQMLNTYCGAVQIISRQRNLDYAARDQQLVVHTIHMYNHHHNRFTALFPGPPR